jgi:thioredoxin reductase (NADPH)
MQNATVIVYSRQDCHLCEDLLDHLRDYVQPELGFTLEVRDIDRHPPWRERYHVRVPVVVVGDEEICEYFLDEVALRRALAG